MCEDLIRSCVVDEARFIDNPTSYSRKFYNASPGHIDSVYWMAARCASDFTHPIGVRNPVETVAFVPLEAKKVLSEDRLSFVLYTHAVGIQETVVVRRYKSCILAHGANI